MSGFTGKDSLVQMRRKWKEKGNRVKRKEIEQEELETEKEGRKEVSCWENYGECSTVCLMDDFTTCFLYDMLMRFLAKNNCVIVIEYCIIRKK